jgi:prepilin-type N-terminal cleavage/methylation domain-containing protein
MLIYSRAPGVGRRSGFTLIELLVSLALGGIVAGAIVTLLLRQQRFYNSTNDVILTRQQLRQAVAMLPSDLKGISSSGKDIYVMTDSSVEFRSVFGSSIACIVNPGGKYVTTVPLSLAKGSAMTNWSVLPSTGDSIAVYNDSTQVGQSDDAWSFYQISKLTAVTGNVNTGCPTASGLVQASDLTGSNPSYQVVLTVAPSNNIDPGAGIRFFRRVHYSIYKASDGQWYLGYYDCKTLRSPVCNAIQAIAGPFQAYAANGTSGLQFTYYDTLGAVTAVPTNVARISLVARGQGAGLVNLSGAGGTTFRDSLRIEIGLENRK